MSVNARVVGVVVVRRVGAKAVSVRLAVVGITALTNLGANVVMVRLAVVGVTIVSVAGAGPLAANGLIDLLLILGNAPMALLVHPRMKE